ncbi:acyl-CoA N-acyltransferase [Acaromyces ingoldii]|uniref:Acyl-CoA N-acyltransferase n=1 Tax=Acaromyces ingoldii TaxID=215250 RepID=A0A316YLV9_9BASI|nr:acyl-CoA N-acyltransferase [Acaromyces ingoldii]PWN89648.1 acyl-CoA N-acyltransferase [Acaromyces ingoldii]
MSATSRQQEQEQDQEQSREEGREQKQEQEQEQEQDQEQGQSEEQEQRRVQIRPYAGESDLDRVRGLIDAQLSEPYTVYTYRYFLNRWPHLCLLAVVPAATDETPTLHARTNGDDNEKRRKQQQQQREKEQEQEGGQQKEEAVGVIIGKLEPAMMGRRKGYIGMISIRETYRRRGLARRLLKSLIATMVISSDMPLTEIFLETEVNNGPSLRLYESVGFQREKRLFRFYLNGNDSFRLVLPLPEALFSGHDAAAGAAGGAARVTREQGSPDRRVLDRMVANGDIM